MTNAFKFGITGIFKRVFLFQINFYDNYSRVELKIMAESIKIMKETDRWN